MMVVVCNSKNHKRKGKEKMKSSTKYKKKKAKINVGWLLKGWTYTCRYQPGYMPIYSLVHKLFKELTLAYNYGFQKYENVKEPLIFCQCFHD
jgi:hypothetical protein